MITEQSYDDHTIASADVVEHIRRAGGDEGGRAEGNAEGGEAADRVGGGMPQAWNRVMGLNEMTGELAIETERVLRDRTIARPDHDNLLPEVFPGSRGGPLPDRRR